MELNFSLISFWRHLFSCHSDRYGITRIFCLRSTYNKYFGVGGNSAFFQMASASQIPASELIKGGIGLGDVQESRKTKDEYRKQKVHF